MKKKNLAILIILPFILAACTQNQPKANQAQGDLDENKPVNSINNEPETIPELRDGEWQVDTQQSTLEWSARRLVGSVHSGTVKIGIGNIKLDNSSASGKIVMDMASITDYDNTTRLIGHLKSDDFFSVDTFPTATLEIKAIQPPSPSYEEANYNVIADLTIKDITNEIVFPAQVEVSDKTLTASAEFNIDRTLWGIRYDSPKFYAELGDSIIKDEIEFKVKIIGEE